MNSTEFCFWLNGFSELTQEVPSPEQWKSIQEHLALVFVKITPPVQYAPNPFYDPTKTYTTDWSQYRNTTVMC